MTHIHTVVVSFHRLELTRRCISSYLQTISVPFSMIVVDNGSYPGDVEWLADWLPNISAPANQIELLPLGKNYYPGYATNRGWEKMHPETTLLHRADNDFAFLYGWCDQVVKRFEENPGLGQLGLRTDKEEQNAEFNVGGNNVIRRELFDMGLRYDEKPWKDYEPGFSEDSYFSPEVRKMGYAWSRVKRRCIESLASGDWDDPYYAKSYGDRRIKRPKNSAPGTR
jgi:GT2 family glycosyltransferase